jgi:hypothetical protein
MKYLRIYETKAEVDITTKPNVVLVKDTNDLLYNAIASGVYIQHIDGKLYTTSKWTAEGFANSLANGVAVISEDASFVIAKSNASSSVWLSNTTELIEGVTATTVYADANADFAGKQNTEKMIAAGTSGAAHACQAYIFPNGKKGYLPSLGEWQVFKQHKTEAENALKLIGGSEIYLTGNKATNDLFTSTQYDATTAWTFRRYNYVHTQASKSETRHVRAFCEL